MKCGFLKNVRRYFKQYCNRTSVHGFQYFDEDRSIFERLWWIIFFAICLVVCGFCISKIYNKWEESPVIVNFANTETSITEIPFPAVTICPIWKTNPNKFSFTKTFRKLQVRDDNVTSEEIRKLNVLQSICPRSTYLRAYSFTIHPEEFFKDLNELQPLFLLKNCIFRKYFGRHCGEIFDPTITEEGICQSFNMIPRDEIFRKNVVLQKKYSTSLFQYTNWTLQNGYPSQQDSNIDYPYRALTSGVKYGLTFSIVSPQEVSDPYCQKTIQGYKMLVHTPTTVPRFIQHYIRIPWDADVLAAIEPQAVKTSKRVQNYSPNRRKCYFETERRLKFFKIYTSSNCKLECLTNYTLFLCRCAAFYMPRENATKICNGEKNVRCTKLAESYMTQLNVEAIQGVDPENIHNKLPWNCDCLPTCSELFYEVEVTQSKWNWMDEIAYRKSSNITVATVTVYFKSDNFIARERNELYGPLDFLASFGGLIGLFTGFSMLSLIEILYFLTVRIICNRRLYGQWAGLES